MKAEITLKHKSDGKKAIQAIYDAWRDDAIHVVTIKPLKKDRRLIQNRLMWHWYKELSKQIDCHGMTKDDLVKQNKLNLGVPILLNDADFAEMWESTKYLSYQQKINIMEFMPVTSIMKISQMTEYLTDFKMYWNQKGVELTTSIDLYYQALGLRGIK